MDSPERQTAIFSDPNNKGTPEGCLKIFDKPTLSVIYESGQTTIKTDTEKISSDQDPIDLINHYLAQGYYAMGYIGYEYGKYTEFGFNPIYGKEGKALPELYFHIFDPGGMKQATPEMLTHNKTNRENPHTPESPTSNMSKSEYLEMVRRAKDYIANGDIYQVNLSQRFKLTKEIDPYNCFLDLYNTQPVPYAGLIDFGSFQIISGSMELFIEKAGNKITTKPIKGTIRRGENTQEDVILRAELVGSEKERAENLMIVDLMRNDLGRICEYGSVGVKNLFKIESYTTLHQMVSEVEGTLKPGLTLTEIIKNLFPPGSVTGAPKKRTLEIIDELEPHYRGPYCGAIGIFYPNGDFTLSVGIRIIVTDAKESTFWVGSGIVWDSDPEQEYEETLLKAKAIKKAIGLR